MSGIVVHLIDKSRSLRILWVLEELGLPYTVQEMRSTAHQCPPELKALHPLGKSPILVDNGVVLAESGAIVEYLIRKYDLSRRFEPTDDQMMDDVYYTHFAEGSLMPVILMKYILMVSPFHIPWLFRLIPRLMCNTIASIATDVILPDQVTMIENHLSKLSPEKPYFCGGADITRADFMMFYALQSLLDLTPDFVKTVTHMRAYLETVHARPAFQRALSRQSTNQLVHRNHIELYKPSIWSAHRALSHPIEFLRPMAAVPKS